MYSDVMCIDFASASTIFRFDFGTDSDSVAFLDFHFIPVDTLYHTV